MCKAMSGLEVTEWEDDSSAMDAVQYDTALLGTAAETETEEAICARLVPGLCEQGDIAQLRLLTSSLTEIPERYLADIIFATLASSDRGRDEALDAMLRVPYTPARMTSEMRRRHLGDVTRLAEHVRRRLQTSEAALMEGLMEWLTVLLDAQYASLVVSDAEQVHDLLLSLSQWREQQELAAREASLLLRELDQLKALQKDPPSPPAADYCVETLQL